MNATCRECHFCQEARCLLSAGAIARKYPKIFCGSYIRTVQGMTDMRDYVTLVSARAANHRGWLLSVLSLSIAALALFERVLELGVSLPGH